MPTRSELPSPGDVYVTRQVHFTAGHRLYNPARSGAWNQRTFGPCANANGHGHNYVLEATVRGIPDVETGYVIDLGQVKRIVEQEYIDLVDHKNFNLDVPFMKDVNPTTENIIVACWRRLEPALKPARLARLKLWETENHYVEYEGR